MYIHEQIALQMAKDRIEEAARAAEQQRAIRLTGARMSARVRLGRSLVQLGHWILGRPSPALS
jgi:hypothetical protein